MAHRFPLALLAIAAACSATPAPGTAPSRIVDGDTFVVRIDGVDERVRIIGMNSPEAGECFAREATAQLEQLIAAHAIELVPDVSDRDRNGRLLRYVEVGGADVGVAMVRDGFAIVRVSEPDVARRSALEAAEAAARADEAGLWSPEACGPTAVPAGVTLEIAGLRLDADGPDDQNLNDEWVEVANRGAAGVDLGGWMIRDESSSHRFTVPAGFVLAPTAHVRVLSGCGDDTPTELHWCVSGSAVWNNDGDTAFLLDPNGNIVATLSR